MFLCFYVLKWFSSAEFINVRYDRHKNVKIKNKGERKKKKKKKKKKRGKREEDILKVTFYFPPSALLSYRCRTPVLVDRNCLCNRFEFPATRAATFRLRGLTEYMLYCCCFFVPTQ